MDTDVEIFEPRQLKKTDSHAFFNVILIQNGKILINNLFKDNGDAENNFINLACEYAEIGINREEARQFLKNRYFYILNGFIEINEPKVKF
jgi:hypothetical protein